MIHVPRIPATIEAVEARMRDSPIQRWVDPRVILVTDREVRFEECGHTPYIEHPERFMAEFTAVLAEGDAALG